MTKQQESKKIPRGIRNNNPLNIRKGSNWKGLVSNPAESSFCTFASMQYGIRAGFVLLRNYITGYNGKTKKFNTIELIVSRWAPPSENNTQNYIRIVESVSNLSHEQIIEFVNESVMIRLVDAMIFVECGQHIDREVIKSAYHMV